MARRLSTMAKYINENWPGFTATVKPSWASTDRKIKGSRLIWPGKGRKGNRLVVVEDATGRVVLDHNAAETYAANEDVERWITKVEEARGGTLDRLKYLPGQEAKRISWLQRCIANERRKLVKPEGFRPEQIEVFEREVERFEQEITELRKGP